ncbi:tRNA-binding protein Pbp11 [Thermococcus peptonophilus]|uniref:Translation factor n=1 Tax=Thermococcus peptonophilus TaxID=53952 RepID=A0A142CW15_9EURY|nr:tRNA-binding protein Pbp11 [Thermococcus peptonophilus]AMQ18967.1 translation factor [Thermococcus peptonophilus]
MIRIFRRKEHKGEGIASRQSVGKFRVEKVLKVAFREVLIGEVLEGIIYPGYKLKGPSVGVIRAIEREHRKVDFAVTGDRVAIMMEAPTKAKEDQILEVYQS